MTNYDMLQARAASRKFRKKVMDAVALVESLRNRVAALEDQRERIAKAFESMPDNTWSSNDVAYVIRNMDVVTDLERELND